MFSYKQIESVWYSNSKYTWIMWPLNLLFLGLVLLKRFLYTKRILSSKYFSKPLLVVGNITVGGTGKTPFILQLVNELKLLGIRAGVVSRGYKAKISLFPHQVTENDSARDIGDEAFMLFANLELPLVIAPNRSKAVEYLIDNNDIDLVISDDGLQHYKMSRDIEIVILDKERGLGNSLIIPLGPLREPSSRLKSVDHVVTNCSEGSEHLANEVFLESTRLVNIKSAIEYPLPHPIEGNINAVAAIGNPGRFLKTLEKIYNVANFVTFNDHHNFCIEDFSQFNNQVVIMTEKDATKCIQFAKVNWFYLKVEMKINHKLVKLLASQINNVRKNKIVTSSVTKEQANG